MEQNNQQENKQGNFKDKKVYVKQYTPIDSIVMFFLILIVPYILSIPLYSITDVEVRRVLGYIIPQVAIILSFILLSVYRKINIKKANQINFKLNIWVVLIVIAIGLIAIFGLSPLVSLFEQIFKNLGYKNPADLEENKLLIPTAWSLVAKIFYIGLLPAICEELAVRGVMANGFKKYGTVFACIFSALMFALMHGNLTQFIYPLIIGFIMAYIVLKTGSIIYTMILHFFNNTIILVTTYLDQKNGVTEAPIDLSNFWNIFLPILFAILAIGAIVGLLFLMNYLNKKQKEKAQQNLEAEQKENTEQVETEKFFKKPMTLEKIVSIIGIVSIFAIWLLEIIGRF